MATWSSDNVILTKLGEQVLSKVQAGIGKLTVSRIVSGSGHVSPSQLYNQTQVTDIKQELIIDRYSTTNSSSSISTSLSNSGITEAYDLYQIGIYVTHPDFTDEILYLIAQCDSPDHIPVPEDTPVTLSYELVMAHSGTDNVTINVTGAGNVSVDTFNQFAEEINTALNGKASSTDLDEHKNDNTIHVTTGEKESWNGKAELTDIPTSLPANGGNAQALTDYNSTDVRIMLGWRGESLDSTTYLAGYDTSELESNGIVKIKDINADKAYVGNAGNADTVDGKHASDFIYARGYLDGIDLDDIKYPCSALALNCIHSPTSQWGTLLVYAGGTGSFTQIYIPTAVDGTPTTMYFRNHGTTGWTTWHNTADGGNADTLDGLHETSFSRNRGDISDCNNAVLPGTYNAIPSTVNTPYSNYWLVSVEIGASGAWIRQTATICDQGKPNETYRRLFINDRWSDSWAKVNDGGNATTVNGLTVKTAVPANAKFTDTTYGAATASANGLMTTGAQTFAGNKTFNGQILPAGASAVGTAQARKIYAGTADMTAGTTALETGAIYLVYE